MKCFKIIASQGFTLIDLLVSLLLGTIIISLGGTALTSIVSANRSLITKQDAQREAAQALEFISNEARAAQSFISEPALINQLQNSTSPFQREVNKFGPLAGLYKEPVVVLHIGLSDSESIVYFLAPAIAPWEGTALYRWGPPFDADGNYELDLTQPDTPTIVPPLDKWVPSLLVDQIFDEAAILNCNGWNPVPQLNPKGLYSCIDPEGRIGEFVFQSKAINTMKLRVKAFARSNP
jgi:type II secretory pathway pseudopilin PulG